MIMMHKEYFGNLEEQTISNKFYRNVIYTTPDSKTQLVVMSLRPNKEIGVEVHENANQFIRVEEGACDCVLQTNKNDTNSQIYHLNKNDTIIIPAGVYHNVINTDMNDTKISVIYNPAQHEYGVKEHDNNPQNNTKKNVKYRFII